MAQPVIIQRLEEAVDSLSSFEEETKAAKEPLEELLDRASELTETVESEGGRTQEAIEEARGTLSELRSRLEEAGQGARGSLQGVGDKASDLASEAGGALARVRELLTELGSASSALTAAVEEGVQATQAECQEIASQVEALQGEMNQGLETALAGIQGLRAALGEARTRIAASRDRWTEALATLEQSAQEKATATAERLHALLERFATSFIDAKNEAIDHHNEAMSELWDSIAAELPEELEPLLDSLTETMSSLEALRSAHSETLQSSCSNVAELARSAASAFDELRSDLGQSAAQLPRGG